MRLPTTIVDPEKVAWQGEAEQVVFGIPDGQVGILPGHADAVFAVQPCIVHITLADSTKRQFFLSGGIARVVKGLLTIVADSAETPESIDRIRAEKALDRAKQRLQQSNHTIDYDRARLALMKAVYRLQIGGDSL
ncbi:MAG: ATP synthase F1 subunit epsilon [Fibrobacterota bacterium]|nr:ATP synthase F1 subunit epsilon [Fibrobacterota bacterium]QQS06298.1 MAG: ATP synthase F1 subunit epsilon [Fibrobacterota bacterium]